MLLTGGPSAPARPARPCLPWGPYKKKAINKLNSQTDRWMVDRWVHTPPLITVPWRLIEVQLLEILSKNPQNHKQTAFIWISIYQGVVLSSYACYVCECMSVCVSPCVRMFKPLEKPIKAYSLNQQWICRITYEVLAESYQCSRAELW